MSTKKLSSSVLSKIQEEHIKPIPKWHYWIKNGLFWTIFLLSAFIGGRGISVIMRIYSESDLGFIMLSHGPFLPPFLTILPLFWIIFFLLFLLFAAYGLHSTKKGYRFSTTKLIALNLGIALVIGIGAFALGDAPGFEEALHPLKKGLRNQKPAYKECNIYKIIQACQHKNLKHFFSGCVINSEIGHFISFIHNL
ncbi:MAG: hypothetical protein U1C97_03440 [Candidatus Gracilibacteria bacterium]|nr:hypothetical protein [bacterium]MDZ4217340.1 hypothetical protein [Candidatus Gracilibacteria bacterium]